VVVIKGIEGVVIKGKGVEVEDLHQVGVVQLRGIPFQGSHVMGTQAMVVRILVCLVRVVEYSIVLVGVKDRETM
jgi:hypothetical protein